MEKRWYAATTRGGVGTLAVQHLHRQGFEAYCPQVAETRRERGREMVRKLQLFPGYVFVSFDVQRDRWRSVNGTIGCGRLLGQTSDALPFPLPIGFVEELLDLQAGGRLTAMRAECAVYHFKKDDKCRVKLGSFEGHEGKFVKYRKGSLILLLMLFGREFEMPLSPQSVEPARALAA